MSTGPCHGRNAAYLDWRVDHPSDDIMTELLNAEFEDKTGTRRRPTREELVTYLMVVTGAARPPASSAGWGRSWPSIPINDARSNRIGHS
jgi:hypothetical protein